jgi:hypothetical protein
MLYNSTALNSPHPRTVIHLYQQYSSRIPQVVRVNYLNFPAQTHLSGLPKIMQLYIFTLLRRMNSDYILTPL